MAEVATAYVTLLPSARGFARGIQGEIGGDLRTAGTRGGKDYAGGMKTGVASMASTVFKPLATAAAALGIGKILSDSITAGSDFQQGLGAADAIFKKNAASIKASAEGAATALGLPKTAYLELATVLGAGLKNKGVKDFTGATQDLIKVGADLAAQFGGETSTAVEAIASALRGESDPIEKYGISLNETAVNAELAAQGVKKTNGAYTEQQKTLARLALIQKQSADAQGTFARESDTYAGSQQRLSASWENIKVQVGSALLPGLTRLSDWFLKEGLPAVQKFGTWVSEKLWPALKQGWETIRPGLERAQKIISEAFGGKNSATLEDFSKFITDMLIPGVATLVNVWLPAAATQFRIVARVVQGVYNIFKTLLDMQARVASALIGTFIKVMNVGADMLEALSNVPGFGWAKDAAAKMRELSGTAAGVKAAIDRIPDSKKITITAQVSMPGRIRLPDGSNVNVGLRAKGGPVKAGQPYIVGERGPELVIPSRSGNVIPNHEAFGDGPKGLPAAATGSPAAIGDAVYDAMRGARFAVDTRENTLATARYRNTRTQL